MSDWELAWLVFAGLYLLESVHLCAAGEACLVQGPFQWRLEGGRLAFKHPLPSGAIFSFKPCPDSSGPSLDGAVLRLEISRLRSAWRAPRFFSFAFFLLAFALLPLAFGLGHSRIFLSLLFLSLACWWGAAGSLFFAARRLWPGKRGRRWLALLHALVTPGFAMRAADALSLELLQPFHPLAAAREFLEPRAFEALCRRLCLELKFNAGPASSFPAALGGLGYEELLEWLKLQGLDPEVLLAPPKPSQAQSRSYCPRCESEFALTQGNCKDCNLALMPFHLPGNPGTN